MKFTSEDLMKAMGLNVGDRVKIKFEVSNTIEERIVNIVSDNNWDICLEHDGVVVPITVLLNKDFEILPKPKRVGDLKCWEIGGSINCPLRFICDCSVSNNSISTKDNLILYQILKLKSDNSYQDQEIYNLLKARLDKEVEE